VNHYFICLFLTTYTSFFIVFIRHKRVFELLNTGYSECLKLLSDGEAVASASTYDILRGHQSLRRGWLTPTWPLGQHARVSRWARPKHIYICCQVKWGHCDVGSASLRFTWYPHNHNANKPSLSFCQQQQNALSWKKNNKKGHLNKPGLVYGLKVLAVVLFRTRDVQKEVHKLFDSIPKNWRKQN
jgi:hypothetical protein